MSDPPFAVTGIDHIVLRVRALPSALVFYRDVLGCRVEREQPELGLTQLRAGCSLIDLVTLEGPLGRASAVAGAAGPNGDHFCLGLAPFSAAGPSALLAARGGGVIAPASRLGAPGEGRSLHLGA